MRLCVTKLRGRKDRSRTTLCDCANFGHRQPPRCNPLHWSLPPTIVIFCVISFPWVQAGLSDSLLTNRSHRKWWRVTCRLGYKRHCGFLLSLSLVCLVCLVCPSVSQISLREASCHAFRPLRQPLKGPWGEEQGLLLTAGWVSSLGTDPPGSARPSRDRSPCWCLECTLTGDLGSEASC